jgi:hypothetical protein
MGASSFKQSGKLVVKLLYAAIIMILVPPEASTSSNVENSTVIWAESPFGLISFTDGDCPSGRALQSYGEVMPDLTDLILRILQKGDSVVDIGTFQLLGFSVCEILQKGDFFVCNEKLYRT